MTHAGTRDGAPTVASRWLWRLKTLARATGESGVLDPAPARDPRRWARALDAPRTIVRLAPPRPKPPAEARPKRTSFTEVEKLIRDPYAIYARRVLGLDVLDPPGAAPGAAERGAAVHNAIEWFADGDDPRALFDLLDRALADQGFDATRRRTERARFAASVAAYIAWNSARRAAGFIAHREVNGAYLFEDGHTLSGRADRIDIRPGKIAEVIDFKTGAPPTARQVNSGLSSQLTLEAAILNKGAFGIDKQNAIAPVPTDALVYWQFGGSDPGETRLKLDADVMAKANEALAELGALLVKYANLQQPYLSKPRAQFANTWSDYDHFARRAEWADAEGEG
jgi:ATP-dependent helicase/nuclease subunit B